MQTAILKAHYDGEHIVLDEPFKLPANAPLMVTAFAPDVERCEDDPLRSCQPRTSLALPGDSLGRKGVGWGGILPPDFRP